MPLVALLGAYFIFGCYPVIVYPLRQVYTLDLVYNRAFWVGVIAFLVVIYRRKYRSFNEVFGSNRNFLLMMVSSFCLGGSWFVFLLSTSTGNLAQGALGYFMSPVLSYFYSVFFFGERLGKIQKFAVAILVAGCIYYIYLLGKVPYYAISNALLWSLYGLVGKLIKVKPSVKLATEASVCFLVILLSINFLGPQFPNLIEPVDLVRPSLEQFLLILVMSFLSVLPQMMFSSALGAKSINLQLVGALQIISPTLHLFWSLYLFREVINVHFLFAYGIVWVSVLFFLGSMVYESQKHRKQLHKTPEVKKI